MWDPQFIVRRGTLLFRWFPLEQKYIYIQPSLAIIKAAELELVKYYFKSFV